MGSNKSYTGVDIGSTAVRAVKVAGRPDSDGFATIEAFAVAPLKGDAVIGGRIRNQQAVAQAMSKALRAVGARPASVVLGASAPEVAVLRLALPSAVRPEERAVAIKTMGVQISPSIPTNESALAMNFVREETTPDGRKVAALVVAATLQTEIDTLLSVCKLAAIEPRAIDLSASGTFRALVRDLPNSRDTATIVDVGATATTVITREGLYVRSVRTFPNGGLDLTRAISAAAKESFDSAERRKYAMRLPTGTAGMPVVLEPEAGYAGIDADDAEYQRRLAAQTNVEQALAVAAENLIDQIAQAVELDASTQGVMTRHLALCGGSALMRGLKERLQRRLNVEVRIGHPWAHLRPTKAHQDYFVKGREDPRLMLSLATATGLALWEPK